MGVRDIYGYPVYENNIGDEVVFVEPDHHTTMTGKIAALNPKGIIVSWIPHGDVWSPYVKTDPEKAKECYVPEHQFVDISQFTR